MSRALLYVLATALLVPACGPSGANQASEVDAGTNPIADATDTTLSDASSTVENAEVYGHSSSTLYRLDPHTLEVSVVADFSGCTGVVDIALDKDSNLYGTTFGGLFAIDRMTAACTAIAGGSYPNSLSFVPAGILDPSAEVLVAFRGSEYIRIDVETGAIGIIGTIGGGFTSSGDVVSVEDGGTFLTVNGPGCNDCLLEINPLNGSLIKNWGPLGFPNVWGLAYWGGVAYGFDDNGTAFSIEFASNSVTSTAISFPDSPAGLSFWGAGSTTRAPVIE